MGEEIALEIGYVYWQITCNDLGLSRRREGPWILAARSVAADRRQPAAAARPGQHHLGAGLVQARGYRPRQLRRVHPYALHGKGLEPAGPRPVVDRGPGCRRLARLMTPCETTGWVYLQVFLTVILVPTLTAARTSRSRPISPAPRSEGLVRLPDRLAYNGKLAPPSELCLQISNSCTSPAPAAFDGQRRHHLRRRGNRAIFDSNSSLKCWAAFCWS